MAVVTDTIADMLTRIRNANAMRYNEVSVPASKLKIELARILKEEGFIKGYKIVKDDAPTPSDADKAEAYDILMGVSE